MNVVDSSGWLEYLAGGKNAGFFAAALEDSRRLLVPALSMFEVFRRVQQLRSRDAALEAVALMRQGQVIVPRRTSGARRRRDQFAGAPADRRQHHPRHRQGTCGDVVDAGRRFRRQARRKVQGVAALRAAVAGQHLSGESRLESGWRPPPTQATSRGGTTRLPSRAARGWSESSFDFPTATQAL